MCKRIFDLGLAGGGLLAFSPLLLLTAFAIRLTIGAPVLFRQERLGLHGRRFLICKFRTMRDAVDRDGQPLSDEQRLTRFGRFLRVSSIDELPELFNVLVGDMSLVGPRPWISAYEARYTPEQMRRHDVRPGITGWAQVNGRNATSWEERLRLDVWYVDHWSLWLDLRILLRTIWTVIRRDGISAAGHATMPRFDEGRPNGSGTSPSETSASETGAARSQDVTGETPPTSAQKSR
ncbi:MAG: sugar transferase [Planctomycetes bacterium]|nr:sugar transferase [Planctomycetota bacterium]